MKKIGSEEEQTIEAEKDIIMRIINQLDAEAENGVSIETTAGNTIKSLQSNGERLGLKASFISQFWKDKSHTFKR